MGIFNANKEISKTSISCRETFQVTLSLSGSASIRKQPLDIVLLLDHSGSMLGEPLKHLKNGVCQFLDVLDVESDGMKNGYIGGGSRVSVVGFSTIATIEAPLTNSVSKLKDAVNAMIASGSTNHQLAFEKAMEALNTTGKNEKVIILFTDGVSSAGYEGYAAAETAKQAGISIYALGYGNPNTLALESFHKWPSSPTSAFMSIQPNLQDIELLFTDLLLNISKDFVKDMVLKDTVQDCFTILSIDETSKGNCVLKSPQSIEWTLSSLGESGPEGAKCTFTVKHTGSCTGNIAVNQWLEYADANNNQVQFPHPILKIDCQDTVLLEDCPVSYDMTMDGCLDSAEYIADDLSLTSLGRILQLSVTLKNVCPNKRVSLAVLLYELDAAGQEHARGMKTMLIPAQSGSTCKDILIRCIKFVLPEELDPAQPETLCNARQFRAKFLANYADIDYFCCKK